MTTSNFDRSSSHLNNLKIAIYLAVNLGRIDASVELLASVGLCPRANASGLAGLIALNLHALNLPNTERFLVALFESEYPEPWIYFASIIYFKNLQGDRGREAANSNIFCIQGYRIFYTSCITILKSESLKTNLTAKLLEHASAKLDRGDFLYLISSEPFSRIDMNWSYKDYVLRCSSRQRNAEHALYGLITHVSNKEDSHFNKQDSKESWNKKGLPSYHIDLGEAFISLPWIIHSYADNESGSTWNGYDIPYNEEKCDTKPFSTTTLANYNKSLGKKRLAQALEITGVIESLCRKLGRALVVLDIGGHYANSFLLSGLNNSWDCIEKWIVADIPEVCAALPGVIDKLYAINSSSLFKDQIRKLDFISLDSLYGGCRIGGVDLIYTCSSLVLEPKLAQRMIHWISLEPSRIFMHQMDYIIESGESESFFQIYKPHIDQYWFLYSARYIKSIVSSALKDHEYKVQEFHCFDNVGLRCAIRASENTDPIGIDTLFFGYDLYDTHGKEYAVGRKNIQIDLL